MEFLKRYTPGIVLTIILALIAKLLSSFLPMGVISPGVFALLLGMSMNPFFSDYKVFNIGAGFVSKQILRLAIILMGATLPYSRKIFWHE